MKKNTMQRQRMRQTAHAQTKKCTLTLISLKNNNHAFQTYVLNLVAILSYKLKPIYRGNLRHCKSENIQSINIKFSISMLQDMCFKNRRL